MKRRFARILMVAAAALACAHPLSAQQKSAEKKNAKPPVVVAASATSYGAGASSVACLLDVTCTGAWSPQSKDGGANEGIYIQFQEPAAFDEIEVTMGPGGSGIVPYLDGMSSLDLLAKEKSKMSDDYEGGGDSALTADNSVTDDGNVLTKIRRRTSEALPGKSKSVFLRFTGGKDTAIKSIRFLKTIDREEEKSEVIKLVLPLSVKTQLAATSVLQPQAAYDAFHLFDSQLDMAWSTNGKQSDGIGASVTVKFEARQDIQGILVWNGYQRSDAHFRANGRVKKLAVGDEEVTLKDQQGMQTIVLTKPVSTDNLTLTIKDIYKGDAYKDVLISELRFLTPSGRIILPEAATLPVSLPPKLEPVVDRTYASFVQGAYTGPLYENFFTGAERYPQCNRSSIRLRSNGTFVIYNDYLEGTHTAKIQPGVIEGNWETQNESGVRLFGKKYRVPIQDQDGYLFYDKRESSLPGPRIFQSAMSIVRFNALPEQEQANILRFFIERRLVRGSFKAGEKKSTNVAIALSVDTDALKGSENINIILGGKDTEEALARLLTNIRLLDPLYVKSDVYTELLLPYEQVSQCLTAYSD